MAVLGRPPDLKPGKELVWPDGHDLKGSAPRKPRVDHAERGGMPDVVVSWYFVLIVSQLPKALEIFALVPRQRDRVRFDCRFHVFANRPRATREL